MIVPPDGWQFAETKIYDVSVSFNVTTRDICISLCCESIGLDASTFEALYLEMKRKGMYDG